MARAPVWFFDSFLSSLVWGEGRRKQRDYVYFPTSAFYGEIMVRLKRAFSGCIYEWGKTCLSRTVLAGAETVAIAKIAKMRLPHIWMPPFLFIIIGFVRLCMHNGCKGGQTKWPCKGIATKRAPGSFRRPFPIWQLRRRLICSGSLCRSMLFCRPLQFRKPAGSAGLPGCTGLHAHCRRAPSGRRGRPSRRRRSL